MGKKLNRIESADLLGKLFKPIRKIIDRVLPDFVGQNLRSQAVRKLIVKAVDKALVAARPEAAAIPAKIREQFIGTILDIVLGPATLP